MFSELWRIIQILGVIFTLLCMGVSSVDGQRARFGDSFVIPDAKIAPPTIGTAPQAQPQVFAPQNTGVVPTTPPAVLQQPSFDPFSIQSPVVSIPQGAQPIQPPPNIYPVPSNLSPSPTGGYFQQWPAGYNTNGSWAESAAAWPSQTWARLRASQAYRLFERPRFRHTFLGGDATGRSLGLNETEIATTITFPNFLFTAQPIRISPGFIFYWWNGPNTMTTGVLLPPRTYSAYVAFDFTTAWNRKFGAELNFTGGIYTDFSEVNSDSWRFTGVGLGWVRMNNTTTFKLGIEYLDRVDIKLLPAGGFFIYPAADLKFDFYFPRPKLARRLPNLGNYEVWSYIGGEYGAGSWTIQQTPTMGDQVDVNDIRAFVGLEWMGVRRVSGFFEVGYVFQRELVYRTAPNVPIRLTDTLMLRAGIAF